MSTGTVMEFNKLARRGRIRPDGWNEDLLTDYLMALSGRTNALEVGQRVCFRISEGPTGMRASQVLIIPRVDFQVEERIIGGPDPIERTLFIDSEPVALVYLDETQREAILAWPLKSNTRLGDVIDFYLTRFLPVRRARSTEKTLGFWIDDQFHEMSLGPEANSELILNIINEKQEESGGFLGLLQITSRDELMELLFDQTVSHPVRLALVISAIRVEPLAELFSSFHKNDVVRHNPGIAMCAFGPESYEYFGSRNLLDPLPIRWENTNELEDLFDR